MCVVLLNVEERVGLGILYGDWLLEENCRVRVFLVVRRMVLWGGGVNCEEVGFLLEEEGEEEVEEI